MTGSVAGLEPAGLTMRGTDTAHDPKHDVYLLVVGNGPVFGVFVNSAGAAVTGAFAIMDGSTGWGHFPRVEYSTHVLGGLGGFLVTWHQNVGAVNCVFGRLVSYSAGGGLASGIQQISDGAQGGSWWETGPAMAYSPTSGRFLVAWRTLAYGIHGRFVDSNGVPYGGILPLADPAPGTGNRDPSLAWNPATDEFGLASTGWDGRGALASFRRIRPSDGFVWGRTDFGFSPGTFATAIDVNSLNNQYVVAWARHPGTMTATFDANGNQLATSFVTNRLGFDQSLGMAFNPVSGTFLAVSSDLNSLEIGAVEVKGSGEPNSTAVIITDGARHGSFYPLPAARAGQNQWTIAYSRDFRGGTSQIVATSSTGGGSGGGGGANPPPPPPPPSGCTTPDPFASLGGGTCVNGGWLPPGSGGAPTPPPPPPPAPAPQPSGCSTPDPFASLGGGTCVNGGWLPPGAGGAPTPPPPAPAPAPAPQPSTCSTPDPFASLGGGTCVNGGWWPPGSGAAPTPQPQPQPQPQPNSCTTPDPFASIGGGTCVNGGWVPGPAANGCTTPDPFVSIGGGVCTNGGWRPR